MNRKSVAVIGLLCFLCSTSLAMAPVGPPTAGLKAEQWSVGFDYAYTEIDFDVDWSSSHASGIADSEGKDVKSDAYLARFGYGISDDWEFYGFLGIADARGEVEGSDISGDFDSGHDFSGGFGTKWTFLKDEGLSWGLVYQMLWGQGDDSGYADLTPLGFGSAEKVDLNLESFDIVLAVGPTYEMGDWRIYGGAGLYYFDTDIEIRRLDTTVVDGEADEAYFGGYIGAQFDLAENTFLSVEYFNAGDASGIGANIGWKF